MFSRHFIVSFCLSFVLLVFSASVAMAESSTGIRLGTTDFGGQQTTRLGTSSDSHSSDFGGRGISHGDHHSFGISDRHQNKQHFDKHRHHKKHRHHDGSFGGIKGHKSFGFTDHHRKKHFHGHVRFPVFFYRGYGVNSYYAPGVYRDSGYDRSTVITGYREPATRYDSGYDQGIDPWAALEDYQIHTARYAFEAQVQQQPHAALPRVGLALSTALAGELDAAAFAMEDALLSDTSDLRYFSANESLRLVLEELLLSYEGDAFMTASLHYLNRDYHAAERAVEVAANYCQQCTAVDKLAGLIEVHI